MQGASVARRQGEWERMTHGVGGALAQAERLRKTEAACARSLLTTGKAMTTVARSKSQREDRCSSGGGLHPPIPGSPTPRSLIFWKKCCVIITGQGDRKDFFKGRMDIDGVVELRARLLYTHEGHSDCAK